jgi:hypothetical protein
MGEHSRKSIARTLPQPPPTPLFNIHEYFQPVFDQQAIEQNYFCFYLRPLRLLHSMKDVILLHLMIGLTALTGVFFALAMSNATTTTREALAPPEICEPDKIDNLEAFKNCQATGEISQDACYAEDIEGNMW